MRSFLDVLRPAAMDRRAFLRATTGLAAAAALPERILADPYAPFTPRRYGGDPVRVQGRVRAGGRGVSGVGVTDGLAVAGTDAEGRFDFVSSTSRDFVSCSLPAGFAIPTQPTGTANLHRPLRPDRRGEMEVVFDLTPLEESDERHAMLLLSDIQTQNAWEMERFHEFSVPDVQLMTASLGDRERFGISCGDIMFDDLALYPEYERAVERMGIPFFQAVGNHDLDVDGRTDEASTATFSRHFGPRYYSFDRGAVHYVVLDDVLWHGSGYIGYLERDQLAWLEADLARVEAGRPVVVALHIPLQGTGHTRQGERRPGVSDSVNNREVLARLLEPFQAHVLSGHTHENDHNWDLGLHEHVSGTVCGAWWSGPICGDGTPNGYSVYEADGEEVRWRYQSTGQRPDHQLRAYLPGADPAAPDEVVANVWDADEAWTVVWYEDGERRGRMARRVGHDPVSIRIHTGDDMPPRRTWVNPYPRYLYYAPAAPGVREVRVEATDRFGRVYSAVAGPVPDDLRAWDR